MQDLRKAADLTADRTGKADCQLEAGMILQKQKDYRAATAAMEVGLRRLAGITRAQSACRTLTTQGTLVPSSLACADCTGVADADSNAPTQAATRLDPRNVAAINMLGLCYTSQGDLQQGIKAYERALRLDPGLKDAWSNLATAHKEARSFAYRCCRASRDDDCASCNVCKRAFLRRCC